MIGGWTFPGVWDAVASVRRDEPALTHGSRRLSWSAFAARSKSLARSLEKTGLGSGGKLALYLHNAPEYMEAAAAALRAGLAPVNTNYRYRGEELRYLWDNADIDAVVFHGTFAGTIDPIRSSLARIRLWLHVDDGSGSCPEWATPYEDAVAASAGQEPAFESSGDDLVLIYTGGTTGLPKGVMWRQNDLFMASNVTRDGSLASAEAVVARLTGTTDFPVGMSAAPLMHGTGFVFATTILHRGGTLVTTEDRQFDAVRLLDAVAGERVSDLCIVGDAFALPIADALDAHPGRWDLSSLRVISSAGMVWSAAVKQRLIAHLPDLLLIDFLNSSEASGMGRSVSSGRSIGRSAKFKLGANAFVIDETGQPLEPGSRIVGRLAVRGHVPCGYYKDPEKSAATFPLIDGVRCAVPGDFAQVLEDGSIQLLGRGSTSINSGGEKIFPEEVEDAIRSFPGVRDALVVGVPDARFGEIVTAAVEPERDTRVEPAAIVAHVRERLARHKAPRHVLIVDTIGRSPSGKADHPAMRGRIVEWLAQGGATGAPRASA